MFHPNCKSTTWPPGKRHFHHACTVVQSGHNQQNQIAKKTNKSCSQKSGTTGLQRKRAEGIYMSWGEAEDRGMGPGASRFPGNRIERGSVREAIGTVLDFFT